MDKLSLNYVWGQEVIPVVLRRTGKGQLLRVRLPYVETNRQWLQNGRRTSPAWTAGKKIGNCRSPGSTTSSIGRWCASARSKSSRPTASRRSARVPARKHKVTNASVRAWAPTMASAMTEAGSRSPTPSRPAWASASSPVVCSPPYNDECPIRRLRHRAPDEFLDDCAVEKHSLDVIPGAFD